MLLKPTFSAVFTSFCLFFTTFSVAFHHIPSRFSQHSFHQETSNILQKMSEWDSENGVWIGDKAISDEKLPSPLYLFGYGSLLWRPGDLLSDYESYSCLCDGWQRLFAQRSSDHRGSVEFPGFVCTLVEESFLAGSSDSLTNLQSMGKIECSGLVWKIPEDKVEATIKELDYRERGGYHRHTIKVTMTEDSEDYKNGDVIDALVYSGSTSNPMFHYLSGGFKQESYKQDGYSVNQIVVDVETREEIVNMVSPGLKQGSGNVRDTSSQYFRPRSATADVIAAAVGPSGYNSEYLFKLRDYMTLKGLDDKYLQTLSQDVSLRMGPWRDRIPIGLNRSQKEIIELLGTELVKSHKTTIEDLNIHFGFNIKNNDLNSFILAGQLLGWGSNEYQQLGAHTVMSHPNDALQSFAAGIGLIEGSLSSDPYVDSSAIQEDSEIIIDTDQLIPTIVDTQKYGNDILRRTQSQVLSGGAFSAFIDSTGTFTTWGRGIDYLNIDQSKIIQPIDNLSILSAASIVSLDNIIGAAMGHEHMLLLQESGWVVAMGDNKSKQCEGPIDFVRNNPIPTYEETSSSNSDGISKSGNYADQPSVKVLKLAAGVRHSAAITMDGYLHVWGTGASAKIDSEENNKVWRPKDDVKLIDVDCGMHHTVVIDELGRVWSFGDDRFGSLGRSAAVPHLVDGVIQPINALKRVAKDSTPRLVEGLEKEVRWQRVSCGWSHTVVRGIRSDGSMASSAWGRRDMSQYPTESTVDSINTINSPQPLSPLPNQSAIREVWTGSEFTVVADEEGLVWSCGWNEHGNLGRGKGINDPNCNDIDDFRSSDNWVAVMRLRSNVQEGKNDDDMYEHLRLTVVWEGVLSCGGGHVLCLTD